MVLGSGLDKGLRGSGLEKGLRARCWVQVGTRACASMFLMLAEGARPFSLVPNPRPYSLVPYPRPCPFSVPTHDPTHVPTRALALTRPVRALIRASPYRGLG